MTAATLLRRVIAILRYAHPDATSIEAAIDEDDGHLRCIVDGKVVPAPPAEAYS